MVRILCAGSRGGGEESNGLELNKADVDENKSTGGACLLIESFLNTNTVRRLTKNDESDLTA